MTRKGVFFLAFELVHIEFQGLCQQTHFVPKSSGFGELPNKHFCGASGPAKIAGVATPALLAVSCDPATWRKNGGHAFLRILRFLGGFHRLDGGLYNFQFSFVQRAQHGVNAFSAFAPAVLGWVKILIY